MNRLKEKFSKLGHGSEKTEQQSEPERERGVLDCDVGTSCYKRNKFGELRGRDQEAFFRFLRGDKYPEKEDICSVDSGNLKGPSRKYQFWLKCERIELKKLFQDYVSTDDDDKRLPEVQDCVSGEEDMESFLKKKEEDAANTEDFINSLKVKMEHELQDKFDEFKKEIEKKFQRK